MAMRAVRTALSLMGRVWSRSPGKPLRRGRSEAESFRAPERAGMRLAC